MIVDPRESVRWPVQWREFSGAYVAGEIQDISPGGVFVRFIAGDELPLTVGTTLELSFATVAIGPVLARGTVRRVGYNPAHRCNGFSVQFEQTLPAVEAYVSRHRRRSTGWVSHAANPRRGTRG